MKHYREGGLVVLGRAYNDARAAAIVAQRVDAPNLKSVDPAELKGVGWNADLHGAPLCAAPMCTTVDDAYWLCHNCQRSGLLPLSGRPSLAIGGSAPSEGRRGSKLGVGGSASR